MFASKGEHDLQPMNKFKVSDELSSQLQRIIPIWSSNRSLLCGLPNRYEACHKVFAFNEHMV